MKKGQANIFDRLLLKPFSNHRIGCLKETVMPQTILRLPSDYPQSIQGLYSVLLGVLFWGKVLLRKPKVLVLEKIE